jgi:hypothetical protein
MAARPEPPAGGTGLFTRRKWRAPGILTRHLRRVTSDSSVSVVVNGGFSHNHQPFMTTECSDRRSISVQDKGAQSETRGDGAVAAPPRAV